MRLHIISTMRQCAVLILSALFAAVSAQYNRPGQAQLGQIGQVGQLSQAQIAQIGQALQLTPAQLAQLQQLAQSGQISQTQLAQIQQLSQAGKLGPPGGLSVIGRLIQLGIIKAQEQNQMIQNQGPPGCSYQCPCRSPPPQYQRPVCGSDGVTYSDACFLRCAQQCNGYIQQVHEGRCRRWGPLKLNADAPK